MLFDFVLAAFCSGGEPPQGRVLKSAGKAHQFAPLAGDGSVFTVDPDVWQHSSGGIDEQARCFCPGREDVAQIVNEAAREDLYCVVALTSLGHFTPPGSKDVRLPLVSWSSLLGGMTGQEFVDLGFDVVDQWTGISALTSLGYSAQDLTALRGLGLNSNEFGLLRSAEDAGVFASFAASAAQEHAPFIPVTSVVRMQRTRRSS
ncbi:MAG: hypothetical protein QM750_21555 [Rubrivivax sp.]